MLWWNSTTFHVRRNQLRNESKGESFIIFVFVFSVIFIHKGGVKGKALLDQIKKSDTQVIACDQLKKEREKEEFVRNVLLDLGRKITSGAVNALVNAAGNDLRELTAACTQIASDTVGIIDEAIVDTYHQGKIETTGFDVAEAVGNSAADFEEGRPLAEPPPAFKRPRRNAPAVRQFGLVQVLQRHRGVPRAVSNDCGEGGR